MKPLRFVLVFFFYVAAELMSPTAGSPVESLDREAEESVQLTGQRRVARLVAERRAPAIAVASVRSATPRSDPHLARARGNPVRKVPAPAPESPSAPEDH